MPGEKKKIGPRRERDYEERKAKGEIPVTPFPDDVNCDIDRPPPSDGRAFARATDHRRRHPCARRGEGRERDSGVGRPGQVCGLSDRFVLLHLGFQASGRSSPTYPSRPAATLTWSCARKSSPGPGGLRLWNGSSTIDCPRPRRPRRRGYRPERPPALRGSAAVVVVDDATWVPAPAARRATNWSRHGGGRPALHIIATMTRSLTRRPSDTSAWPRRLETPIGPRRSAPAELRPQGPPA